jgi:serine/threonine protein kinase
MGPVIRGECDDINVDIMYQSIVESAFHVNPTAAHRSLREEMECPPPPLTISLGSGVSGASDGRSAYDDVSSSYRPSSYRPENDRGGLMSRGVLDDYVILPRVLGRGAYGEVRECVRIDTRNAYACKTIYKSTMKNINDLRRELDLLVDIDHPNVIRMVGCYETDDMVHIITERCGGGELFDRIIKYTTEDGCFDEVVASRMIRSLLSAVEYLHENDIVHRDIKPENILLETDLVDADIRLIDFGLSRRHTRDDVHMSRSVGTGYYMSPELLAGRYDRSTDIWSIGIVTYILLCGYPPFRGDNDEEVYESIKRGKLEFPTRAWSDKSKGARDFIRCTLRRDPRKRFTAREALAHPWVAKSVKRRPLVGRVTYPSA